MLPTALVILAISLSRIYPVIANGKAIEIKWEKVRNWERLGEGAWKILPPKIRRKNAWTKYYEHSQEFFFFLKKLQYNNAAPPKLSILSITSICTESWRVCSAKYNLIHTNLITLKQSTRWNKGCWYLLSCAGESKLWKYLESPQAQNCYLVKRKN